MDKREAEFMAKLLKTFKVEAEEHLKALSDGLIALEGDIPAENQQKTLEVVYREAHSLKGAARAVNLRIVENVCQSLENVLSKWKKNELKIKPSEFDILYAVVDLISKLISQEESSPSENRQPAVESLVQQLDLISSGSGNQEAPKEPEALLEKTKDAQKKDEALPNKPLHEKKDKAAEPLPPSKLKSSPDTSEGTPNPCDRSIRVSTQKLDRLFQQAEETLIIKLAAEHRASELKKLQEQICNWEKEWGRNQIEVRMLQANFEKDSSQAQSGHYITKQIFDYLYWQQESLKGMREKIGKLAKSSSQDFRVVGSIVDTLLDDMKKLLMQPFAIMLESFPRMVRDLSHSLGKEIKLIMQGADIEIDRRILDEMKDPLIHLIRNSIDHGIEKSEDRAGSGKNTVGTVVISASQITGNKVEITVSDDGAGIDLEKVKKSALAQKIISQKEEENLTEQQALMLIFQSGLSTSPIITELSGRGLGMGIVSEKVEKLGGQLFVETKKGLGTTIRIVLPITLATFRGIHVKVYQQDFIIPTNHVKRVIRIKPDDIKTVENREMISLDGNTLSYVTLGKLLGIPQQRSDLAQKEKENKYFFAVVIKVVETMIAYGVDQILSEQEILVKGLGRQLVGVKNIAAATIVELGKVIPILNPIDLAKAAVQGALVPVHPIISEESQELLQKVILVVEDSITARTLLKNILESAGYLVKTAVDGSEAMTELMAEGADLLLSDIEMPNMDGLELTEKVRGMDKFKDLPIVLCTSRGSKEDRERGISAGANAYIDKSSFDHSNMLDIIQKLL